MEDQATYKLLIARHGEAAREPPGGGPDRDRPLTDRGEQNVRMLGGRLNTQGLVLHHMLSSPAARAAATARRLAEQLRYPVEDIAFDETIYNASLSTLLERVSETDDAHRTIAIVGHNPGLSELAAGLCTEPVPGLPPGGAVLLAFPALEGWLHLAPGRGRLLLRDFGRGG